MDSSQHKEANIARMVWIISSPVVCTLGILGNLMTIIVLTKCKKTSTSVFLTFLATGDLLVLMTVLPRWWLIYMFRFDIRHVSNVVCKLHWFITYLAGTFSAWIMAAVTVERTICTMVPHKVKALCTVKTATVVSLFIFVSLTVINGHTLFGLKLFEVTIYDLPNEIEPSKNTSQLRFSWTEDTILLDVKNATSQTTTNTSNNQVGNGTSCDFSCMQGFTDETLIVEASENMLNARTLLLCWYDDPQYGYFFDGPWQGLYLVGYFVIPEAVFFVGAIFVVRKLQFSRRLRRVMTSKGSRSDNSKPADDNQATQITMTLMFVNILFTVCATPVSLYLIGRSAWVADTGMTEAQEIIWAIVNQMYSLNHACNFILYFLSGSRFRQQVKDTFRCKRINVYRGGQSKITTTTSLPTELFSVSNTA